MDQCASLDNSSSVFGTTEFCVSSREVIQAMKAMSPDLSSSFPLPVLCISCLIIGCASNGLVLAIIATDSSFRTLTNAILASFSASAVIFLMLSVPVVVGRQSHDSWNGSRWLCILSNYFEFFANANFVWHLVIVALQIYIVVIHPLKARSIITKTRGTLVILSTWVFSAVLALIAAVSSALNRTLYSTSSSMSDVLWSINNCIVRLPLPASYGDLGIQLYFLLHCILLFAVPFLILLYIYTCVIKKLWFSTKQFRRSVAAGQSQTSSRSHAASRLQAGQREPADAAGAATTAAASAAASASVAVSAAADLEAAQPLNSRRVSGRTRSRSTASSGAAGSLHQQQEAGGGGGRNPNVEKRKQIIIMLLVVMVVFFLGWLPKTAFSLFSLHKLRSVDGDTVIVILMTLFQNLPFVQCCVNPFIYVFVSQNWRTGLARLLRRASPCLNRRRRHSEHEQQQLNGLCLQTLQEVN